MRGLGASFLLRRARASWLLLACVAVTVLLATAVAAVLWTFAAAVIPFGAQGILADPRGRVMGFNGPVDARQAAADSQQIRTRLRQAWPGVAVQLESARWTQTLQLPSLAGGTTIRQIQLASLEGFRSFALVLVLAMVAFPDMISTSVTRAQVAASWQQVGADAVIEVRPPLEGIPPALQQQVSALPGVVATASAAVVTGSLSSGSTLSLMYVNPARWAAVVDRAPGPRFPRAALSGNTATGLPALATPAAAELVGTTPAEVSLAGSPAITIRLAGRISSIPGATADDVVIVPQEPSGTDPDAVNLMLLAGPRLDGARLTAAVRRLLPDASVTVRSSVLAALGSAPVLQAAKTALTQGLAVAAGFGVLVLLLSLLLTAQTRELTLASLATMGLRRGQAQLLLATETLPPVVAAAIGGVACAWLLAPLVGPSLNLAAYSGTGSAIAVTPAALPLAASAAGLVLAALLVLAAQAVITYYRGSARALRIAD